MQPISKSPADMEVKAKLDALLLRMRELKADGTSVYEISRTSGVAQQLIYDFMSGKSKTLTLLTYTRLQKALLP